MLTKIYKKIADKTLSFWSKVTVEIWLSCITATVLEHSWINIRLHNISSNVHNASSWNLHINERWYVWMNSKEIIKKALSEWKLEIVNPIYLWRVISLLEERDEDSWEYFYSTKWMYCVCNNVVHSILKLRSLKWKPIDDQPIECITFIYNLCKDD